MLKAFSGLAKWWKGRDGRKALSQALTEETTATIEQALADGIAAVDWERVRALAGVDFTQLNVKVEPATVAKVEPKAITNAPLAKPPKKAAKTSTAKLKPSVPKAPRKRASRAKAKP